MGKRKLRFLYQLQKDKPADKAIARTVAKLGKKLHISTDIQVVRIAIMEMADRHGIEVK